MEIYLILAVTRLSNLLTSIEKSKNTSLDRVIFGLGIRHVGKTSSRILALNYEDLYDLMECAVLAQNQNSIEYNNSRLSGASGLATEFLRIKGACIIPAILVYLFCSVRSFSMNTFILCSNHKRSLRRLWPTANPETPKKFQITSNKIIKIVNTLTRPKSIF